MTLGEIIIEECGEQPAEFADYLHKEAVKLNAERFPDRAIESSSVVALPFCHKVERQAVDSVETGDSLYEIAKRNMGVAGNKTLASIVELNQGPNGPSRKQIERFSEALSVGRDLALPFRTTERVFHQVSGGETPREIITRNPPVGFELLAALETVTPTDQPRVHQLEPVGFVPSNSPVTTGECPASGELPASPPFNLAQVRERLAAEISFLQGIGAPPQVAVVGIIDTGLKEIGNEFFQEKLFSVNKDEIGPLAEKDRDDDNNGHRDDIWGTNFTGKDGIVFTFGGDDSEHGTRMAALALGGVDFVQSILPIEEPFVKLRIVNFNATLTNGLLGGTVFPDAVKYLASGTEPGANIINVSLKASTNVWPIRNAIFNHEEILFIAAAANDLSGGKDLSLVPAYPARLGGNNDFVANIVTVASHRSDGRHAIHSNWGTNVDLHAPGCAINSINTKGAKVTETGSSVAAAVVSFTAGVIRALGGSRMPPEQIKKRLIASSDMDAELRNKSWTGARLNVIKAISLSHDVIEIKNAISYLFSKIDNIEKLRTFCKEEAQRRQLENIVKIRPNIRVEGSADLRIEYWVDTPGRIAKITCTQDRSSESIGTLIIGDQQEVGPRLADIVDIVIAPLRIH